MKKAAMTIEPVQDEELLKGLRALHGATLLYMHVIIPNVLSTVLESSPPLGS